MAHRGTQVRVPSKLLLATKSPQNEQLGTARVFPCSLDGSNPLSPFKDLDFGQNWR